MPHPCASGQPRVCAGGDDHQRRGRRHDPVPLDRDGVLESQWEALQFGAVISATDAITALIAAASSALSMAPLWSSD